MNPIRVGWLFFRVGVMNDLQYRVNFFIQLLQSAIALTVGLIGLWLIFSHTSRLNGWSEPELLVVMGIFTLTGGLIRTVIEPAMTKLMDDIRQGTLDYALTKPEDSQLIVSMRQIQIWQAVDILTGIVVVVIAMVQLGSRLGVLQIVAFLAVLIMGGLMVYSFWLTLTTAAFWIIRMDEITELFQGIYAAGRYPVGVYPTWLRYGLTFLVPVAFAVTIPAEALTGRLSGRTMLGAAALTVCLLVLSRWFWRFGLKHYSGASA